MARKPAAYYRIRKLTETWEKENRARFLRFINSIKNSMKLEQIEQLVRRNDVAGIMRLVNAQTAILGSIVNDTFIAAGNLETELLQGAVNVGLAFDPGNERAAAIARQDRSNLIQGFVEDEFEMVRRTMQRGLRSGANPRDVARGLVDSIGLTAKQQGAVDNYEDMLRGEAARQREALTRDLRDRRYDAQVKQSANTGEPLSEKQIKTMVGRYKDKYLKYRADAISRTETTRAVSKGRQEALRQTVDAADIPMENVRRVWNSSGDNRTRDSHSAMDQQQRGIDEPFQSPSGARIRYPGDNLAPPEESIHCRCVVTNLIL